MAIDYKRIGERIQKARKLKNLSIADLSQQVHFTPQSIVYAENGQATLSLEFLLDLCTALNLSPNDLLEGEYQCDRTTSLEQEATLAEMKELLDSLREEMGVREPGDTIIKDTQTALEQFRQAVVEYRQEIKRNARVDAKPAKKKITHW